MSLCSPESICICCGAKFLRRWSPSPNLCSVCVSLDFATGSATGRDALRTDLPAADGADDGLPVDSKSAPSNFSEITQTREGFGSNGKDQQERDGYIPASELSDSAAGPNVCREGRIATVPVFENSARGGYVGAQAFNQDDGPERALSPKTGYVPAEDTRQVPNPPNFPANAAVSSPSPILHGQRRVRTADLPFAGTHSMTDKQRIDATVERAVAEILLQLPSIQPERLKEFATICVKEGMRLGIREAQMTIAEGLKV